VTTVKFSYEGGVNGNNVAAGAGASTGDTNFDVVNIGSGATNQYSNTHPGRGLLGVKFATGATSTTTYDSWTTAIGTQTTTFVRALCFFTQAPAANHRVVNWVGSATSRGNILLNTAGKFIFTNAAGGTVLTSAAVPLNSQFRLEAKFVASATVGFWEYKIWYDPRSVGTPDDTNSSAATQNMGGTSDTYRFGIGAAAANVVAFYLDDVAVSTDDYIGPENPLVTGTAAITAKKCSVAVLGFTGAVTITAKKPSLDVIDRSTVTGAVRLKKMIVAGSVTETTTISGGPRLKKMIVAGSVTVTQNASDVTGDIHLKKMAVAGLVTETTEISGDLRLKKMTIAGSSTEMTVVSGGPAMKKMRVHVNAVRPVASPLMVFTAV
jgi:hypothetical protein